MKNLGELFLKEWFPEQNKRLPKFDNKYDSGYAQVTVIPKKTIHVVYTKDGKPVLRGVGSAVWSTDSTGKLAFLDNMLSFFIMEVDEMGNFSSKDRELK